MKTRRNPETVFPTNYAGIGYVHDEGTQVGYRTDSGKFGRGRNVSIWRFVSLEDGARVGPQFTNRAALLRALPVYATDYGAPRINPRSDPGSPGNPWKSSKEGWTKIGKKHYQHVTGVRVRYINNDWRWEVQGGSKNDGYQYNTLCVAMNAAAKTPIVPRFNPRRRCNPDMFSQIRPGSRVTILNRFGQKQSGPATLPGPHGWVISNRSGASPFIATPANTVHVSAPNASSRRSMF